MKKDEKQNLFNLIENGNLKAAIETLLSLELHPDKRKEAQSISFQYNELKSKERTGMLSFEQVKTSENQIANNLIELINADEEEILSVRKTMFRVIRNVKRDL